MATKKQNKPKIPHLEWNQLQLQIAYYLQQGLTPKELVEDYDFKQRTIYKVKLALQGNDAPVDITQEMIDEAPPPSKPFKKKKKAAEDGEEAPATVDEDEKKEEKKTVTKVPLKPKVPVSQSAMMEFIAQKQTMPITPDIYISYMVAVKNGYGGSLGDWLSLTAIDFWTGRDRNPYAEIAESIMPPEEEEVGTPI